MKNTTLTMGAQTIAAAIAFTTSATFGSSTVLAQETAKQNTGPIAKASSEQCQDSDTATCEAADDKAIELIRIHGVQQSIYRYAKSGDPRRLADLVDTPQTISVLTQDQIQESGKTDLKDILSAQAGVTLRRVDLS
jgi:catecholate siderophore receptor